jgi:hypothetical protein
MLIGRAIDPVVGDLCEHGGQGLFTKPVTGLEDGATSDGGGLVFGWEHETQMVDDLLNGAVA